MIKQLVVNGASFTEGSGWASQVKKNLHVDNYINLARNGAGNFYICNSTIDFLETQQYNPSETLVLIMWAGTGNYDIRISGEWYHHLLNSNYTLLHNPIGNREDTYYLLSGGLANSWATTRESKNIFTWHYKINDPETLCKDSLMQFIFLENYLKVRGYKFLYINSGNCWKTQDPCFYSGNYSIGYFCSNIPTYKNYSLENWLFINDNFEGLYEFSKSRNELDSTDHPTQAGHYAFADEIVIPAISKFFS